MTQAFKQCINNPSAGGRRIRGFFEIAAQDLVDDFEDAFRADYELNFDMRDAA